MRHVWTIAAAGVIAAACADPLPVDLALARVAGDAQTDTVGRTLEPYVVLVTDRAGMPAPGIAVRWSVVAGEGAIAPESMSDAQGIAQATLTLDTVAGTQTTRAVVDGALGSPVTFTATAVAAGPASLVKVAGDGQTGNPGQPLAAAYVVAVRDQYGNAVANATVAWAASAGSLSAATSATNGAGEAQVRHTLAGAPALQQVTATVPGTATPGVTFSARAITPPPLVATVPVPANYGLHDTFVRDGIAFLSSWNSGVLIYDVGNGIKNGFPGSPQLVSQVVTQTSGLSGANVHNAWWFHNPTNGEKRYLFVGQEGPGSVGASSSGDIHVVDVSDLEAPVEVAFYHLNGAGTHNFWMDEQAQVLFAAYYNGGVVALDVSGPLSGDLASRELARIQPGGGGNTYTWGVMQSGGSVYAADMRSGFWQLRFTGTAFSVAGGGNNVPERWTSDLWVHGTHAYTGTWGSRGGNLGNAVKIWRLNAAGAPTLVDSVIVANITTVSDVEVSADGRLLVISAEGGANAGVHVYALADPEKPALLGSYLVGAGVHTAAIGDVLGRRYVFAAKNPGSPALFILDITDFAN